MGGIGWMVEDHLVEIVNLWRRHLARELPGVTDPALGYAAPVFLRELAKALRQDDPTETNPFRRCELLLKIAPGEGLSGLVHEFRLLRRATWEVLRAHGRLVSPQDRSIADEKIDEAIAIAVGRLAERPAEREPRPRNLARITAEARGEARGMTPRTAIDETARVGTKSLLAPIPRAPSLPVPAGRAMRAPAAPGEAPMSPIPVGATSTPIAVPRPPPSPARGRGAPADGRRPAWRAPWRRAASNGNGSTPPPLPVPVEPIPDA